MLPNILGETALTKAAFDLDMNIFYLLAAKGNTVADLSRENTPAQVWSNEYCWYLPVIHRSGFPWNVRKKEDCLKVLDTSDSVKDPTMIEHVIQKKSFVMKESNVSLFLASEWESYEFAKAQFLIQIAEEFLCSMISQQSEQDACTYAEQSHVWDDMSCAYDASISIISYLCLHLYDSGSYPKLCNGR